MAMDQYLYSYRYHLFGGWTFIIRSDFDEHGILEVEAVWDIHTWYPPKLKPTILQWEFQDPKLEVPTIYKAYVREYPHKIWPYMVQYLHFRILEFPLKILRSPWRKPGK